MTGLAGLQVFNAAPAISEQISTGSLLQYQYHVDVPSCNVIISKKLRFEFDGVFANEGKNTVFHELVNLVIHTNADFGISTIINVASEGEDYKGKVVYSQPGKVIIAVDASFLNVILKGGGSFTIQNLGTPPYIAPLHFGAPRNIEAMRKAVRRGQSCQEDAATAN